MTPLLLCLVSLVLYTAHSSQCNNGHTQQSLLLSVSVNGKQVDKIGQTEYLSVIQQAADAIAPSSGRMGLNIFGGVTISQGVSGTITETKLNMGSTTSTNLQSTITGLSSVDFGTHSGNAVSSAVDDAISTSWSGQKYHVVFSSGIPLTIGQGTSTTPDNFDDPCPNSVNAKKNNIQQYVALIGIEGTDYIKEYFSCLVEDPDTDIIGIDPTNPTTGINLLKARLCKTGGIDFKITEVNPIGGSPFIEVLNRGKTATISVCWTTGCSGGSSTATGSYYQNNVGTAPQGGNGWTATARAVAGSDSLIRSVSHSGTGMQNIITGDGTGRSFELRAPGYNDQYGGNWRMSCNPNENGTPGSAPVDCTEKASSCVKADCDVSGAGTTSCVSGTEVDSACQCDSNYLEDFNACIAMDAPTSCNAYVIFDDTASKDFVYFVFPRAKWDGPMQYSVTYPSPSGTSTEGPHGVAAIAKSEVGSGVKTGSSVSITVTAQYTSPAKSVVVSKSAALSCSVATLRPTAHPSTTPTQVPTRSPSGIPTPPPTHDAPGVFMKDLCSPSRCECFDAERTCCYPFGRHLGPTLTSGIIPAAGCHNVFKKVEMETSDQKEGRSEGIVFEKYGDSAETTVEYTITYHGLINKTKFTNLSDWAPTTRRLQDATPSPTLKYGNPLNIQVSPPGDDQVSTGTLTMATGETSVELLLDIQVETLKCVQGGECPTTYDDCITQGLGYQIEVNSCTSGGSASCSPMYPYVAWMMVYRSNAVCKIAFGIGNDEEPLPTWLWWVLLALLIFLLCLCWLVYRFWWKQKKHATELGDAVDELDQQQADNEAGFGKDLDVGDVAFNPMATGVPGMNRPADAFGNELHQRQLQQQNDMVDVQAEIFQVRQDYGQVATGPRRDQQQQQRF